MHLSKIVESLKSKKSTLFLLYFTLFVIFSISKIYINVVSKTRKERNLQMLNVNYNTNISEYKSTLKKRFHLNIFDFYEFQSLQNRDIQDPGTCVQTRIEVSV